MNDNPQVKNLSWRTELNILTSNLTLNNCLTKSSKGLTLNQGAKTLQGGKEYDQSKSDRQRSTNHSQVFKG